MVLSICTSVGTEELFLLSPPSLGNSYLSSIFQLRCHIFFRFLFFFPLRLNSYPSQARRYILYLSMVTMTLVTLGFYIVLFTCLSSWLFLCPLGSESASYSFCISRIQPSIRQITKTQNILFNMKLVEVLALDWNLVTWLWQFFLPLRFLEDNSIRQHRISILYVIVRG